MSDPITRLNAALEARYVIKRELGEGGMATVYLADDLMHERKVALKVLKPELAALVGAERFLGEIKTTANLTHPHILHSPVRRRLHRHRLVRGVERPDGKLNNHKDFQS